MEGEQRTMRMLMQTMPKKGFVLTFGLFFVVLIACVVIGVLGPEVYEVLPISAYDCPEGQNTYDPISCNGVDLMQNGTYWVGEIRDLDRLNQELYLIMNIKNKLKAEAGVDTDIYITVALEGRNGDDVPWEPMMSNDTHKRPIKCVQGRDLCDDVIVAHELWIKFSSYRVNVSLEYGRSEYDVSFIGDVIFTYTYVAHAYTLFELWFRFSFLIITFIILIIYSYRLKGYSWHEWTFEQKWGAVLLFGLMAYNNPFYPLEIVASGWFPIFLNRLLYASFLVLLLYFWLILFDGIRKEASERNFKGFYLPKIVLLGLFWITGIIVFTWVELHEKDDPLYSAADELPGYIFFQVFLLILLIVYIFWLIYATCRACGDIKTLPYLGVRIKFFGIFTLLVILTVVGGLIFGYGAKVNSAAEFLSFLSLFNLYVYTLAFVYLPSQVVTTAPAPRTERIGMVRLEEDDPVEMTNVGGRA